MKKFLCKLCAFIILFSVIILILNWMYLPIADSYGTKKFFNMPEGIQICNFGSSHGLNGFNYDGVSDKFSCFNFSLHSQTLMYDYRILKHYVNHIKEGGIVFVIISYFSLFGEPEIESDDWFIGLNKRYYKILSPEEIKYYDPITNIFVNDLPDLPVLDFDIKHLFSAVFKDTGIRTVENYGDIKQLGEKRAAFHFRGIRSAEDGKLNFNHEKTDALYNIIKLCRENKLIPILVTTPYLKEYSDPFKRDSEFINAFRSIINEVINTTGVRYYDYSEDERFSHDYKLFVDTDHLNKNGALKFTNTIISEVMHDLNL